MTAARKVYLIGLDGFNRGLFDYLNNRGVIPHLRNLVFSGTGGILESTRPPYTGPAWVSMFTGTNPGEHGIYGFTRRCPDSYQTQVLNGSNIKPARIWDYLSARGKTAGVFNVPFTYPVRNLKGFMVSGMLTPSLESDCVWPPQESREFKARYPEYLFDLGIDPDLDSGKTGTVELIGREQRLKSGYLLELVDRYDPEFMMAVFTSPDRVMHLWGKSLLDSNESVFPWTAGVDRLFFELDETLGRVCSRLGEEDLLIIASDHGFAGLKRTFYLNNWLVQEGYLSLKGGGKGISGLMGSLNRPWIKRLVPRRFLDSCRSGGWGDLIDWSRTKAYASPGMEEGIYLNLAGHQPQGTVPEGEFATRLLKDIREGLLALSPPVFKNVFYRDELYKGVLANQSPDLILDFLEPGWNMSSSLTGSSLFRDFGGAPVGVHYRDGFWAASGPGIKEGWGVRAGIEDIAPTVLAFMGMSRPAAMRGKVLPGVVVPRQLAPPPDLVDSSPRPSSFYQAAEESELKERLSGLGYL